MGLKERDTSQPEEKGGKSAEWIPADEFQYGRLKIGLYRREESLPLPTVLFEELLPPKEGLEGNIKDLADLLYRAETEGMLSQDTENEEQAVPAVRNDRIREHSV